MKSSPYVKIFGEFAISLLLFAKTIGATYCGGKDSDCNDDRPFFLETCENIDISGEICVCKENYILSLVTGNCEFAFKKFEAFYVVGPKNIEEGETLSLQIIFNETSATNRTNWNYQWEITEGNRNAVSVDSWFQKSITMKNLKSGNYKFTAVVSNSTVRGTYLYELHILRPKQNIFPQAQNLTINAQFSACGQQERNISEVSDLLLKIGSPHEKIFICTATPFQNHNLSQKWSRINGVVKELQEPYQDLCRQNPPYSRMEDKKEISEEEDDDNYFMKPIKKFKTNKKQEKMTTISPPSDRKLDLFVNITISGGTAILNASMGGFVRFLWTPLQNSSAFVKVFKDLYTSPVIVLTGLEHDVSYGYNLMAWDSQGRNKSVSMYFNVTQNKNKKNGTRIFVNDITPSMFTMKFLDRFVHRIKMIILSNLDLSEGEQRASSNLSVNVLDVHKDSLNDRILLDLLMLHEGTTINSSIILEILRRNAFLLQKDFGTLDFEQLGCPFDCSDHGICSGLSNQCECDWFWMPNLYNRFVLNGNRSEDCSWFLPYFIGLLLFVGVLPVLLRIRSVIKMSEKEPSEKLRFDRTIKTMNVTKNSKLPLDIGCRSPTNVARRKLHPLTYEYGSF